MKKQEATLAVLSIYDVYKCLRNALNTASAHQPIYINGEAILPCSLVMLLEDGDATLETRYEAERCPQPVAPAPTSTKKASNYDRKEIAGKAHYYAKASNIGTYHKRFGKGLKEAWTEAKKAAGIVVKTSIMPIMDVAPKPAKAPDPITYPSIFDYDILYYSPTQYALYTESQPFNSTCNHTLRY